MTKSQIQMNASLVQIDGKIDMVFSEFEKSIAKNTKELADIHKCMDRLSKRVHENAEIIQKHSFALKVASIIANAFLAVITGVLINEVSG